MGRESCSLWCSRAVRYHGITIVNNPPSSSLQQYFSITQPSAACTQTTRQMLVYHTEYVIITSSSVQMLQRCLMRIDSGLTFSAERARASVNTRRAAVGFELSSRGASGASDHSHAARVLQSAAATHAHARWFPHGALRGTHAR